MRSGHTILAAHSLIILIIIETYDSYFAFIAQPKPHGVVFVVMSSTGTSAAVRVSTSVSVFTPPALAVKVFSLKVLATVRQTAGITKVARIHTLCNEVAMIMI